MAFDWFKRKAKNITTSTDEKRTFPRAYGIRLHQEKLWNMMN